MRKVIMGLAGFGLVIAVWLFFVAAHDDIAELLVGAPILWAGSLISLTACVIAPPSKSN